jgi:hypothetical protein
MVLHLASASRRALGPTQPIQWIPCALSSPHPAIRFQSTSSQPITL